jgi:uncharacterized protein (TIGR03435 family)
MRLATIVLVAITALGGLFAAQAPPSFDAASVKPNTSGDWRKSIGPAPGGRFLATNNTLRDLIPFAFGVPQAMAAIRIVGGPNWIDEDRFDVVAKVDGTWTPQQMSAMLRGLLVDRFALVAHRETREMPTYALVVASPNPHLRRSEIDQAACDARREAIQRREPVPAVPPGSKPVCPTGRTVPGSITAVGWSFETLATTLSPWVGRMIVDRTQLSGLFDFELTWTPDQQTRMPDDAPPIAIDPNGPSIFTALQEQLGLKLESARGPVDVVVIDSVRRPTPD